MYNKKENEKPLFAEVKSCDDEVRQQATNKDYKQQQRDQRIPYIKLTYPNGVTLNVPSTIDIKMIEQYVRINGRVLIRRN